MANEPIKIIRRLPPAEWRAYRMLRLEALLIDPDAFGTTYDSACLHPDERWQGRLEAAWRQEDEWLVFSRDGFGLCGMVGAMRERESPDTAYLVSMFVSPLSRSRGVGRRLVETLLEDLATAGIRRVVLDVRATQMDAYRLYRSLGFLDSEEQGSDEIRMERNLGPANR